MEVLFAALILTIIAVGSGAFLYHGRSVVLAQRNKRVAIEVAGTRLEKLRAGAVKPASTNSYTSYYVKESGTNWLKTTTDPGETVVINGIAFPIVTKLQYVDVDGSPVSYDCVKATVSVGYRTGADEKITLDTLYVP